MSLPNALDPLSPHFSPTAWFNAAAAARSGSTSKPLGVSFCDLSVHGFRSATDYQQTFGNYPLCLLQAVGASLFKTTSVDIIRSFDGLVRSGEMLLVLGRPGSGCSTLLKTLAGDTHGLSLHPDSRINYQGIPFQEMHAEFRGECIYTAEVDVHFPELTVGETLEIAARARASACPLEGASAQHIRDVLVALLHLQSAVDTKLGNELIRGVSGGERKRVSIAEALAGWSPMQCWDNATRGLDSATAYSVVQTLRLYTRTAASTAIMTLYQASQSIYDTFDKVTVLYEGVQIFFGTVDEAKLYFEELGFACPPKATTADFLTSLTQPGEVSALVREGFEHIAPRNRQDFRDAWLKSKYRARLLKNIADFEREYPLRGPQMDLFRRSRTSERSPALPRHSPYTISASDQMLLCVIRAFRRLRNNYGPPVSAVIGNVVMAVVVGSIFYNLDETTNSFYSRGVLLFFAVLLNAFMSSFEVLTMWAQRPIVEKQNRYAFYQPYVESVASIVADLPTKIITSLFFNLTLYFMTNLRRTSGAFFTFYLVTFTCLITMSMFFRMVGSVSRTMAQTMAPVAIFLVNYMIYTGFVVPIRYMHPWLRWIGYIDPVSYAFESLMINEFHDRNFPCGSFVPQGLAYVDADPAERVCSAVGAVVGQDFVSGDTYIRLSFSYDHSHLWRNLGILVGIGCFFCCAHLLASEFIQAERSKGEVLLFRRGQSPQFSGGRTDEEAGAAATTFPHKPDKMPKGLPQKGHRQNGVIPSLSTGVFGIQTRGAVIHWDGVNYDVKTDKYRKRLLSDVDGWVQPGTLTALMGVTGAGKTTLLDVLASRAVGIVSGEIMVNGHPRDSSFQRKTGYVQQADLHLCTSTVREALRFSALLRQPESTPQKEKLEYVEDVIKMLEMEAYADAVVGFPGEGLNVEQRKRLTIAIEMVANPEFLLFLDEPTSGLDSQTAWSICTLLRKLAMHGQAIMCTVHQPSAMLFQIFDQLLLLQTPGKTIYFGPLGEDCRIMVEYFENNGATRCGEGDNPADWVLNVVVPATGTQKPIDWASIWKDSAERAAVKQQLARMKHGFREVAVSSIHSPPREYAASFVSQLYLVSQRGFAELWRTPKYLWSMFFLCFGTAFFIGFSFWDSPNSIQGIQNQMFAIFLILTIFSNIQQLIIPKFAERRALYEARERQSKTYSWPVFVLSSILVELPWQSLISVTLFVVWYFPIGMFRNAAGQDENERAGLMLFCLWAYMVFCATFSIMLIAGIENAGTAVQIAQLFYYLLLIFCGILVRSTALPGFWAFMYHLSPLTYLAAAMMAAGIANVPIVCSDIEVLSVVPPVGSTCEEYLSAYQSYAGGTIIDPGGDDKCGFCPIQDTNVYLDLLSVSYSKRWRNASLIFAYITFNVIGTFVLYRLFRMPKGQTSVENGEERKKGR